MFTSRDFALLVETGNNCYATDSSDTITITACSLSVKLQGISTYLLTQPHVWPVGIPQCA